jgi:5-methylcytosine-specific restriction endonuclease McrA
MPMRPKSNRPHTEPRPNSSARGYDRQWRKLRLLILQRDPICKLCSTYRPGRTPAPSTTVDHRTPKNKGGTDDPTNLQGACHYCNSRKRDG